MKRFLLYTLIVIKNATIIFPFLEGMISALANMIEQDKQKEKKDAEKTKVIDAVVESKEVQQ